MNNIEKLNAIITADFDYFAELTAAMDELQNSIWEDDDIEAVMAKHSLNVEEVAAIMEAMINAEYLASVNALNAADKGAAAAVNALDTDDITRNDLYNKIWHDIHKAVMPVEYRKLAQVK